MVPGNLWLEEDFLNGRCGHLKGSTVDYPRLEPVFPACEVLHALWQDVQEGLPDPEELPAFQQMPLERL